MARFGTTTDAETLVVCGVRFMGENGQDLEPREAGADAGPRRDLLARRGLPSRCVRAFCDAHPDHSVVVYANTSAAVKARADWMVTSSIALPIVRHLHQRGEKVLWAPDKHLGHYIERVTGVEMLLWPGACVVHEEFKGFALERLRRLHPAAAVLVHPESPDEVVDQADVVGSTTALIRAVTELPNTEFIVATDAGIFWKMRQLAPHKT